VKLKDVFVIVVVLGLVLYTVWKDWPKNDPSGLNVQKLGSRYIVSGPKSAFENLTSEQFDKWDKEL